MDQDKIAQMVDNHQRTVDILTIKLSDNMSLEFEHTCWDQGWMLLLDEEGRGTGITDTTALALIQAINGPKTTITQSSRLMEDDELNERKDLAMRDD